MKMLLFGNHPNKNLEEISILIIATTLHIYGTELALEIIRNHTLNVGDSDSRVSQTRAQSKRVEKLLQNASHNHHTTPTKARIRSAIELYGRAQTTLFDGRTNKSTIFQEQGVGGRLDMLS
jgi:hypothetical protein